VTRSLFDDPGLDAPFLSRLAGRARQRRLASDLADAELEEGLWMDRELETVSVTLPRMAADSRSSGRYVTDPPLELHDGQRLVVTLEPTTDASWIASARRLLASPGDPRPALVLRLWATDGSRSARLLLPEGEETVAALLSFDPGATPTVEVQVDPG